MAKRGIVTDPEERKLEADKIQMEYFEQIGAFSLAGAVLLVTLFGAFGSQNGPNLLLVLASFGSVFQFSVSLSACAIGLWSVAEDRAAPGPWSSVVRFSPPRRQAAFIDSLRFTAGATFISGAVGFFIAAIGIIAIYGRVFGG